MMLGQVIRRLEDMDDDAILALIGDPVLFARLRTAASAVDQPAAAYARQAIGQFLHAGSEEEWTTVIGRMRNDSVPGDRLIVYAIERQLQRDGT